VPAAASLGLLLVVGLAWWALPPAAETTLGSSQHITDRSHPANGSGEAAPTGGRPAFLTKRIQQAWSSEMVMENAFHLLDSPASPGEERRFDEFLGNLHVGQIQVLESALTASQAQGVDRSWALGVLWQYWAGLCPASAQSHAASDPERMRQFGQALSRLSAEEETAILTQLTKP
jgi:hypothetical protein